jgi:hypothetical protein
MGSSGTDALVGRARTARARAVLGMFRLILGYRLDLQAGFSQCSVRSGRGKCRQSMRARPAPRRASAAGLPGGAIARRTCWSVRLVIRISVPLSQTRLLRLNDSQLWPWPFGYQRQRCTISTDPTASLVAGRTAGQAAADKARRCTESCPREVSRRP